MSYDSSRQAGTEKTEEIEITPAMIEAGLTVLYSVLSEDELGGVLPEDFIKDLYSSIHARASENASPHR